MSQREVVLRDLDESARDFKELVWPVVSEWLGGGELVPVEGEEDREMFDLYAGIDAWHLEGNQRRIRGIASRVQRHPWLYSSFTVRRSRTTGAKTEFRKRLEAIRHPEEGWLFPHITVQGYVHGGELMGAGCTYTRDLYEHIAGGRPPRRKSGRNLRGHDYDIRVNADDGNEYFVVWWERLRQVGIRVRTTGDERLADESCKCRECWGCGSNECEGCGKKLPHDPRAIEPYPWPRCLKCEVAAA